MLYKTLRKVGDQEASKEVCGNGGHTAMMIMMTVVIISISLFRSFIFV